MEKEYLRYLDTIFKYEEDRQKTIENKLSQLIGQTGLVFALSSLFIPLFYGHLKNTSFYFVFGCIILFVIALVMLSWCILIVTKTLDVRLYKYMTGSVSSLNKPYDTIQDFNKIEIEDLKKCIETNSQTNNIKATHLILASRKFAIGIISIGILSLLILSGLMFMDNSASKIEITNQVNMENIERGILDLNRNLKTINETIDSMKSLNDTIYK